MWNLGEPLPQSNLAGMVEVLERENNVNKTTTCPYDEFFAKKNDKKKEQGKGGGGGGRNEDGQPKKKVRGQQATTNPEIPPLCAAAVK